MARSPFCLADSRLCALRFGQRRKKDRLLPRIAAVRQQLATLKCNLEKLLAEEAKAAATEDATHSPDA